MSLMAARAVGLFELAKQLRVIELAFQVAGQELAYHGRDGPAPLGEFDHVVHDVLPDRSLFLIHPLRWIGNFAGIGPGMAHRRYIAHLSDSSSQVPLSASVNWLGKGRPSLNKD